MAMRLPRIKLEGDGGGHFHVMSRIAEGKFIFDPMNPGTSGAVAAEKFREMMVKLARFHGIEIFTWALLSNHLMAKHPC